MTNLYCVYMMSNRAGSAIYTGMSSALAQRVQQHKDKVVDGFTKRYNLTLLVYYECSDSVEAARQRERQIKAGSRAKKLALVRSANPQWRDLSEDL